MAQTVKAIAESINIMGKRSGTAMKERNPGPIQEMAKEETAAGSTYLDLNIGPARIIAKVYISLEQTPFLRIKHFYSIFVTIVAVIITERGIMRKFN